MSLVIRDGTRKQFQMPHCNKCNRQVDEVDVEYHTRVIHNGLFASEVVHTGVVTLTIKCHGETWQQTGRIDL